MAIWSWPGFGKLGTSPGWEVPVAGRDAGAARERRGSRGRPGRGFAGRAPVRAGVDQPAALGAESRAEPSRAEPSEFMSAPPAPRRASSRPDSFPVPARAPGTPLLPSATARAAVWRLALSGLLAVSALPGVAGLAHAEVLVSNLGQTTTLLRST